MENTNCDLDITIFTDPLCCWSWAFEPQLQQLKNKLTRATWSYCMVGLLPSWDNFHDNINSVSRPMQMGPVWMHAGQIAKKKIAHTLWITDPPASSYPGCIAVKCAQLQSDTAGELMLSLLREACMTEGKNIAKQEIVFDTANKLNAVYREFKLAPFKQDFLGEAGLEAFRADLGMVTYYRINRFPTLLIKPSPGKPILIPGYRRYEELLAAIKNLSGTESQIDT